MDIEILAAFGGLPAAVTMTVSVLKTLANLTARGTQIAVFAVTAALVAGSALSGLFPPGTEVIYIVLYGIYSAAAAMGIHEVATKNRNHA